MACKGLQLFWFALRTTLFWVLRSVQVVRVGAAKALGDEMAVSDAASKALETSSDNILRMR